MSTKHGIVVLDFGGQYTQLIARRIREEEVFSAILPCTAKLEDIRALEPVGIVLSGGPSSVYDEDAPHCDTAVLQLGVPVLGICYGMQWLTHSLGGKVGLAKRREYGPAQLDIACASKLFAGIPNRLKIWNSHGDHVVEVPPGFAITGRTDNADRLLRTRRKEILRRRISPRSEPHRPRHRNPAQFRLRDLRREEKLEPRRVHRRHC